MALLACAGCGPSRPPPPPLAYAGFPVTGSVAFARAAGFRDCFNTDAVSLRCRRHAVTFLGEGPYEAAVDLGGGWGERGFDQLTLWSDDDNDAVYRVIIGLARRGWRYCYTGTEEWSDQAIFSRPGERVRMLMDISYWGRRRLRVVPSTSRIGLDKPCTPDRSLMRFGQDVARAAQQ